MLHPDAGEPQQLAVALIVHVLNELAGVVPRVAEAKRKSGGPTLTTAVKAPRPHGGSRFPRPALLRGPLRLIAAGAFVASGKLSLRLVIAVAPAAAIIGDNLGFAFGRR